MIVTAFLKSTPIGNNWPLEHSTLVTLLPQQKPLVSAQSECIVYLMS